MQVRWLLFLSVCSLFVLSPTFAQKAASPSLPPPPPANAVAFVPPWTPHPVRDEQALNQVQASITALGGSAAFAAVSSYIVQGQLTAASGTSLASGSVTWTVSAGQVLYDFPTKEGMAVSSSGNGMPFLTVNSQTKPIPPHLLRATLVPPLIGPALFAELQNANCSLRYAGSGSLGAEAVTIVKTASQTTLLDSIVTPQVWYFDSTTNLPVRIEYYVPDSKYPSRHIQVAEDFSAYQAIGGLLYPSQAARSVQGNQVEVISISSIQPNAPVDPSVFNSPAGGAR